MSLKYYIHSSSVAESSAEIGEGTEIAEFSFIEGNSVIGKHCKIGRNVTIAEGVIVGDNVSIDHNVSLESGVILENSVYLGYSTVLSTKSHMNRFHNTLKQLLKPIIIKDSALIGPNSTIFPGITIGQYAIVGAGSVISESIDNFKSVSGNPPIDIGWVCICGTALNIDDKPNQILCDLCETLYLIEEKKLTLIKRGRHCFS